MRVQRVCGGDASLIARRSSHIHITHHTSLITRRSSLITRCSCKIVYHASLTARSHSRAVPSAAITYCDLTHVFDGAAVAVIHFEGCKVDPPREPKLDAKSRLAGSRRSIYLGIAPRRRPTWGGRVVVDERASVNHRDARWRSGQRRAPRWPRGWRWLRLAGHHARERWRDRGATGTGRQFYAHRRGCRRISIRKEKRYGATFELM